MKNMMKLLVALLAATVILTACGKEKVEDKKDEEKKEEKVSIEDLAEEYLRDFAENAEDGYTLYAESDEQTIKVDVTDEEEYTVFVAAEGIEVNYTCSEKDGNSADINGMELDDDQLEEFGIDEFCPGKIPSEFGMFLDDDFVKDIIRDFDEYEFTEEKKYIVLVNDDDEEIHIYKDGSKLVIIDDETEFEVEVK